MKTRETNQKNQVQGYNKTNRKMYYLKHVKGNALNKLKCG